MTKTIKVLGNSHNGIPNINELWEKIGERSSIQWRTDKELIAVVEEKQKRTKELLELRSKNQATEEEIKELYKMLERNSSWLDLKVIEVDTSRKWVLSEYDSSVGIQYLKEEEFIEEMGYYGSL